MKARKRIAVLLCLLAALSLFLAATLAAAQPRDNLADPTVTPETVYLPIAIGGSPPQPDLHLTEFVYEGADEYLEITNQGTGPQDMTGWRIHSVVGPQWYDFPGGYTLAADAAVRVHSGEGALDNPPADLLWGYAYVWLNEGDKAILYDDASQAIDEWCYGTGCP
jgi:hypothetical protein